MGSLIALGGYFVVCAARGGPFFLDRVGETPAIVRNLIIRCSNARRPLITRALELPSLASGKLSVRF